MVLNDFLKKQIDLSGHIEAFVPVRSEICLKPHRITLTMWTLHLYRSFQRFLVQEVLFYVIFIRLCTFCAVHI